jgi:hypothetical protein
MPEASARNGTGLEEWFNHITATDQTPRLAMEIDYELYADGEALLGWLNCTLNLIGEEPFDGDAVLKRMAGEIQQRLLADGKEIAHLKMTLSPDSSLGGIATINLVRSDFVAELSQSLEDPVESGQLIVNLRAEAEPEILEQAVRMALLKTGKMFPMLTMSLEHWEHFRPGKPMPTHRFATMM